MAIKFECKKDLKTIMQECIDKCASSKETYEVKVIEEKFNDTYQNISIQIRKVS